MSLETHSQEHAANTGGFSGSRLAHLREVMAGHVERGSLPGLVWLLSRCGETQTGAIGTMAVGGSAPMQRDTIFRIASMSKPITAAAAMMLVEERRLQLDEPVDRWLPELSNRKVLRSIDAALDDTVPAQRPISLRDLLTFRFGIGMLMVPPGRYPIQQAITDAGLAPGPNPPLLAPDEWMRRLGSLPLIHQPGEQWLYHTGFDVLGVLIARASGQSFESFLDERLFEPLGMQNTGFHVPPEKLPRLSTSYMSDPASGETVLHDEPDNSRWAGPQVFASGGGGLVSTVDDYLAFCRMMLNKGEHRGESGRIRILSRPTVELMTTDHLTSGQKEANPIFFGGNSGWGFGLAVHTQPDEFSPVPGRFGWTGGIGTSAYSDPHEDLVGILMTQRMMDSPQSPEVFSDFWTSAYQALATPHSTTEGEHHVPHDHH